MKIQFSFFNQTKALYFSLLRLTGLFLTFDFFYCNFICPEIEFWNVQFSLFIQSQILDGFVYLVCPGWPGVFLTFDFFIHCNNRLPRYISCLAIENCYFHFLDRFLSCVLRLTINVFNFSIAIEVEFLKCYFQFSLFNQTKTTSFILFAQVDQECFNCPFYSLQKPSVQMSK